MNRTKSTIAALVLCASVAACSSAPDPASIEAQIILACSAVPMDVRQRSPLFTQICADPAGYARDAAMAAAAIKALREAPWR